MDIHSRTVEFIDSDRPFCVVVVLSAEGSTPREAGVRAIVDADGRIYGTVGGGPVELEAQRAAIQACRSGQPVVIEAELAGAGSGDREPICGGYMRLLIDPTARKDAEAYRAAAQALRERRPGVLLTRAHSGPPLVTEVTWHSNDLVPDPLALPNIGPETRECAWVLAEPILPGLRLVIAGGGHIGQALAAQAVLVGFDVTVIDDRPEFSDPALFPLEAKTRCGDIAALLAEAETDGDTYIVIVTRGHRHDAEALRVCLRKPAAYLGMIGSRRKVALIREDLLASGAATEDELNAVYAPIGLDIGAETVPEIATSILAEMIAVRRKGRADRCPQAMRDP